MRQGTFLFLLLLILLFALYGWKAIGWVAVAIASFLLLLLAAAMASLWMVRRRMRKAMGELRTMLEQQQEALQAMQGRDVIDVEPDEVRDEGPSNR